jgi:enoyl-CoA hydratase
VLPIEPEFTVDFETLSVTLDSGIARITLNRPDKANAMTLAMWHELRRAFAWVDRTPEARVAVLNGAGRHFTAGIDLAMLAGVGEAIRSDCEGRSREKLRALILDLQDCLTAAERCRTPVIAAIHGSCIGGGVDLVCACDIRLASADARFAIKEIDMGMTADVGTLQRMPKLVAPGIVAELALTGRTFDAEEARAIGFVNRVFETPEHLADEATEVAATIAAKSPLAVRGTKATLRYARDHTVADGLEHVAGWNAAMLLSSDLTEAMQAAMTKRPPRFDD